MPLLFFADYAKICVFFEKDGPRVMVKGKHLRFADRELQAIRGLSADFKFSTRAIAKLFDVSSAAISYHLRVQASAPPTPPALSRAQKAAIARRKRVVKRLATKVTIVRDADGAVLRRVPTFGSASVISRAMAQQENIVVTKQTVINDLHAIGFHSRVRQRLCDTTHADATRRSNFARKMLLWPISALKRIVFSDEKWFSSNDCTWRRQWVPQGGATLPREKQRWPRGRVLVWAAIGHGYREIVICPEMGEQSEEGTRKPFRMSAAQYVRRCLSKVVPYLLASNSFFQQDGAAAHTAKTTIAYLQRKLVALVPDWPARSPQYNVIETFWAILEPRVAQHHPMNRQQLIAAILHEFAAIPQSTIDALVAGFPARLAL